MISQAVMNLATGPSAQTRGPESEMVMERARRLGAQNFHGTSDLSEADDWFQGMEGVFEAMQSSEEDKLRVATYMLRGGAWDWWKSIKGRQTRGTVLTWEDFRREFFVQYYPEVYLDQQRKRFLGLRQEKMSMAEYETTFTQLSRFSEGFMRGEVERCRFFLNGLNLEIKAKVETQHYNGYAELVQLALRVAMYENMFISRRQ